MISSPNCPVCHWIILVGSRFVSLLCFKILKKILHLSEFVVDRLPKVFTLGNQSSLFSLKIVSVAHLDLLASSFCYAVDRLHGWAVCNDNFSLTRDRSFARLDRV